MPAKVKVVHLEDDTADSELFDLLLREAGMDCDIVRVASRDEFVEALQGSTDIIVSDYRLPGYDGLEALREARARRPEVPFVFFTGALGEAQAIGALKAGATDYVLKDGAVERLVPAIKRALREADAHRDKEQAVKALQRERFFLRQVIDTSPSFIFAKDREGRFTLVNQGLAEAFGTTVEDVLGKTDADFNPNRDEVEAFRRDDVEVMDSGVENIVAEEVITDATGKRRWLYTVKRPLLGPDGVADQVLGVALDITARKEVEDELRQAQKMDAIGRLAGGIAHDFNNVLGVILGYGERVLRRLPPAERREIGEVLKAAEHAASLTRQLLAFSRKQVLQPRVLDLNAVVREMHGMLRRIIGENMDLVTVLKEGLGPVKADPGQIQQVIMNLAINARDAMPKGGRLTIETDNVELDESYVAAHLAAVPGHYVMLAVTDTGRGMDAATQARIFEPFFTTKEVGKGTGLGLSTVFGIVKQSGGSIEVYSELGHGTTFKVYLPRVDEAVLEGSTATAETPSGGAETILLVEDSDSLRELGREILEEAGYKVMEAGSGNSALEALEQHTGSIDLILTDLVMPGMSGRELADEITGKRPGTKVLYMSGYTEDALGHLRAIEPGTAFVQKPFTIDGLLRKVREVLDS